MLRNFDEVVNRAVAGLATTMDRRQFIRRVAEVSFVTAATFVAGVAIDRDEAFAQNLACDGSTIGYGYPGNPIYSGNAPPCGPDPCCHALQTGCQCWNDTTQTCINNGGTCGGNYPHSEWYPGNCWTCYGNYYTCGTCQCRYITTCCDCYLTPAYYLDCNPHTDDEVCIGVSMVHEKLCPQAAPVYRQVSTKEWSSQ